MDAQQSYFGNDGYYAQPIEHTSHQVTSFDAPLDPFIWWYYQQEGLTNGDMGLNDSLLFTPSTVQLEPLSVNPSLLFAPPTSLETVTGYPDMTRIGDHGDLEPAAPVLPPPTGDVLSEQNLNIAAAAGYESDGDASMGDEDAEGEDDEEWVPSIASIKRKARNSAHPPFQRSPTAVATNVPDDATVIASPVADQKAALAAMDEGPATSHARGAATAPVRKRARGGKDSRSEPRRRRTSSASTTAAATTFTCTFSDCSKGYARKAELDRHVLSHTEAPRACGVCGAHLRTNRADVLRRHQLMTSECVKLQRTLSNAELREKGCVTHHEREVAQAKAGEKAKRASRTTKGRAKARS